MSAHLLIADEDRELAEAVAWYLRAEGIRVTVATEAAEAMKIVTEDPPHAAVMDAAFAGADGFDQIQRLQRATIPVMVLTASDIETAQVCELGLGQAYASKPLGPLELAARARMLLDASSVLKTSPVSVPGLEVLFSERRVLYIGKLIPLSPLQFILLTTFIAHPYRCLSRAEIADSLWGEEYYGDLRLVDRHVAILRRCLRQAGVISDPIKTVRGGGYAFQPPD